MNRHSAIFDWLATFNDAALRFHAAVFGIAFAASNRNYSSPGFIDSVRVPIRTRCRFTSTKGGFAVISLPTILLIVLILLLLGAIPTWPHSRGWGYGPSGIVGVLVIILIVLLISGRI